MVQGIEVVENLTLVADDFEEAAFHRGEDALEFGAAFQYMPGLPDQGPHALAMAEPRAFFDPKFGTFGRPAESRKGRGVATKIDGIVTPMARRYHAAIKVQNPLQFRSIETNL